MGKMHRLRTMLGQSGGGYAFRLCKKEGKGSCTEEADFLKLPYLQFVSTKLRWQDGTEENKHVDVQKLILQIRRPLFRGRACGAALLTTWYHRQGPYFK